MESDSIGLCVAGERARGSGVRLVGGQRGDCAVSVGAGRPAGRAACVCLSVCLSVCLCVCVDGWARMRWTMVERNPWARERKRSDGWPLSISSIQLPRPSSCQSRRRLPATILLARRYLSLSPSKQGRTGWEGQPRDSRSRPSMADAESAARAKGTCGIHPLSSFFPVHVEPLAARSRPLVKELPAAGRSSPVTPSVKSQ
jgi:hypothetical protein